MPVRVLTEIDLQNYYTKTELDALLASKADKEPGVGYSKTLTIDGTKVYGTQAGFPMYVNIVGDADLAAHAAADGTDILFEKGGTQLNRTLLEYAPKLNSDASWTWYNEPRGVRHVGTKDCTYIGFVNKLGYPVIGCLNHVTGAWTEQVLKTNAGAPVDDHDNPTIVVRSDGRLLVMYQAHNWQYRYWFISTNAEDITAWTEYSHDFGSGNSASYSHLFQLSGESNKLYDFARKKTGSNWSQVMRTSTDGGLTWAETTFFTNGTVQRPYLKAWSNGTNRIDFCYTTGHPNETTDNSLYHMYYQGGNLYKTDGTLIGAVTSGAVLANLTLVYNGSTTRGWNWDIDGNGGNPVIVYSTHGTAGINPEIWYAKWNGSAWVRTKISDTTMIADYRELYYTAGACIDHNNVNNVYLCKADGSNSIDVYKYVTADGGSTFTNTRLTSGSHRKNFRPFCPKNAHADLQCVWNHGDYSYWTMYNTGLRTYPAIRKKVDARFEVIADLANGASDAIVMKYGTGATVSSAAHPALLRKGQAEMQVIGSPNMAGFTGLTVEVLMQMDVVDDANQHFLSNWDNANLAQFMFRTSNARVLQAFVMLNGNTQIGGSFADLTVPLDALRYVAFKYDQTAVQGFMDTAKSTTTFASTLAFDADTSGPLWVSKSAHQDIDPNQNRFFGGVYEIRIWNTAKSDDFLKTSANNFKGLLYTVGAETAL